MKCILFAIKPRWCVLIMKREKTVEVRTSKALASAIQKLIDKYGYADIYGYCSKTNYLGFISNKYVGKVNFKFRCYKVEEIACNCLYNGVDLDTYYMTEDLEYDSLEKQSCLTNNELRMYLGKGKNIQSDIVGYAIHISDLEIFKPKELSEFYPYCKDEKCEYRKNHCSICYRPPLTKAPQNFCYVEVE